MIKLSFCSIERRELKPSSGPLCYSLYASLYVIIDRYFSLRWGGLCGDKSGVTDVDKPFFSFLALLV